MAIAGNKTEQQLFYPWDSIPSRSLDDLARSFPKEWEETSRQLAKALEDGRAKKLGNLMLNAQSSAQIWRQRVKASHNHPKVLQSALPYILKERLILLGVEKCCLAIAARQTEGVVRFNLWNGWLIQHLLFEKGLERKLVPMRKFQFWWKWVTQKRILLPLVQPKGIYCFYSQELIFELQKRMEGKRCLEIAAGDGFLSRQLRSKGVDIVPTDDQSWSHAIQYPSDVERIDARQAIAKYCPRVVLCSWPPPGNSFEKHVFVYSNVGTYVVIGSHHRFACGNWNVYQEQRGFQWTIDKDLSSLVLPPGLDFAVHLFHRLCP